MKREHPKEHQTTVENEGRRKMAAKAAKEVCYLEILLLKSKSPYSIARNFCFIEPELLPNDYVLRCGNGFQTSAVAWK